MEDIGFICDIREQTKLSRVVGSSRQMRAIPLAIELKNRGINLFIYTWHHVNPQTGMTSGYYLGDKTLMPVMRRIPRVNGTWFLGNFTQTNIGGMNYKKFMAWCEQQHIEIYPPYSFDRLVSDKFSTFELVVNYDPSLHPYTEVYQATKEQLGRFAQKYNTIFIKPRGGSQGNKIAIIKKMTDGFELLYYQDRSKLSFNSSDIEYHVKKISELIKNRNYIIQAGIDVQRYEEGAFIVRTIMLHDGLDWHWMKKLVVSPPHGDIANTEQDGMNYTVEEIFEKIYGDSSNEVVSVLKEKSFGLSQYFDSIYPAQLVEVAIDFVVDENANFYVSEVDVTPGLIKPGMDVDDPFKDIFNISDAELPLYNRYVVPQARFMADFFVSKIKP